MPLNKSNFKPLKSMTLPNKNSRNLQFNIFLPIFHVTLASCHNVELKKSDIPPWKDLYRLKNLPKKGLKSPRKSLYNERKAKLVFLEVQQILSDEEQAVLDSKLENGEILIVYK